MCNNRIKFDPDQSKSDEEKMFSVSRFRRCSGHKLRSSY